MLIRIAALLAALAMAGAAAAQKAEVFSDGGAAIRGYDPVAYFTEGRPVKGSGEFTHRWKGPTWRFASAKASWLKDVPGYIRKADANWPRALAR